MGVGVDAVRPSICLWCKGECGVLVRTAAERLLSVDPDPAWPERTHLSPAGCSRRKAAVDYFYHPDRLNFPLKRCGSRGEGRWRRISWVGALDEIAAVLERIRDRQGPEAIALLGKASLPQDEFRRKFAAMLGAFDAGEGIDACAEIGGLAARAVAGQVPVPAVGPGARCIVLLGCEPLISRPVLAGHMLEALKEGARLIVINPHRTKSASRADVWLRLRPGTDTAVLLAMINTIIEEGLYDRDFVENWCSGFSRLRKVAGRYPAGVVAAEAGVPEAGIRAAARLYATTRPGVIVAGKGVYGRDALRTLYCRWILAALAGNIDVQGGEELHELPEEWGAAGEEAPPPAGAGRVPVGGQSLYARILRGEPHPVRALLVGGRNPLVGYPGTRTVYQAFNALDLLVVMDFFKTPSAQLADYVLPAASWLERPDIWRSLERKGGLLIKPAVMPGLVPGRYEHYCDFDLWRGLAVRLGFAGLWPWENLEEAYESRLSRLGFDLSDRREVPPEPYREKKYLRRGFNTPSGKVELCAGILNGLSRDPVPGRRGTPGEAGAAAGEDYPYVLLAGGKVCHYCGSEWRQIAFIRCRHPYPVVQLSSDTARRLSLKDGDWAWIETRWGRIRQRVKLSSSLPPGKVLAEAGWWLPERSGRKPGLHGIWEVNPNACFDETGGDFKEIPCRVYRADPPDNYGCNYSGVSMREALTSSTVLGSILTTTL